MQIVVAILTLCHVGIFAQSQNDKSGYVKSEITLNRCTQLTLEGTTHDLIGRGEVVNIIADAGEYFLVDIDGTYFKLRKVCFRNQDDISKELHLNGVDIAKLAIDSASLIRIIADKQAYESKLRSHELKFERMDSLGRTNFPFQFEWIKVREINSVGGVDFNLSLKYLKKDKVIKYLEITIIPYNAVGDVVKCRIRGLSKILCIH